MNAGTVATKEYTCYRCKKPIRGGEIIAKGHGKVGWCHHLCAGMPESSSNPTPPAPKKPRYIVSANKSRCALCRDAIQEGQVAVHTMVGPMKQWVHDMCQ